MDTDMDRNNFREQLAQSRQKRHQKTASAVSALTDLICELSGKTPGQVQSIAPKTSADYSKILQSDTSKANAEVSEIRRQSEDQRLSDQIKAFLEQSGAKRSRTFDTLSIDQYNSKAINTVKGVTSIIRAGLSEKKPVLLLITGAPGTGKTVLSHAFANQWVMEMAKSVKLINFERLMETKKILNAEPWSSTSARQRDYQTFLKCDLLIIDGLCANSQALNSYEQKIFLELLNYRFEHNLSMMITSVVTPRNGYLHEAIGDACFDALSSFNVMAEELGGLSRRERFTLGGQTVY